MSQFIVGIDLGTTHTVVAYAPLAVKKGKKKTGLAGEIRLFAIEQLVAPGEVAALPLLPSCRYHASPAEFAEGELQLPWPQPRADDAPPVVVGRLARQLGAQVPGRLVASAKSWLSHTTVDRLAPILPWGGDADVPKVSPVQASASYLAHVKAAWNTKFPDSPLDLQDLVLTVPASFDESARSLTLLAATDAGLPKLRLLEEPQAVFYDWLLRHQASLPTELQASRLVLVCDVGGGTTDLSLIKVEQVDGQPKLTRIGVGSHLMLGGDNMDLTLAHALEARMEKTAPDSSVAPLTASRLSQLVERCRVAKELLLGANAPDQTLVTLLGTGSRLIGGSRSTPLTRKDVEDLIVDGFFPAVDRSEPVRASRRGIVEFGLPYARDPAITRHIAAFLRQHAGAARQALGQPTGHGAADDVPVPDTLLLNGGVFHGDALVKRLQHTLAGWRGEPLRLLHNDNPDAAVARGAVAYALAQQGRTEKIGGGAAHSYFLLLDDRLEAPRGICILARGTEPGVEIRLTDRTFSLRIGQPVRFHLCSASADGVDQAPFVAGQLVTLAGDGFVRLPPIAMALSGAGSKVDRREIAVQLVTSLTEVGTLELHCVSVADASQRWLLAFELRHETAPNHPAVEADLQRQTLPPRVKEAVDRVERIFGSRGQQVSSKDVTQLRAQLERILGAREQWDIPILRQLFDALWLRARGRRRSAEHERVWFNLAGYCLRPGFGDPLDDWRMQQLWGLFPAGVQFPGDTQVRSQWWTLWRRVAGGLAGPDQLRLLDDFAYNLQANEKGLEPGTTRPIKGSSEDMLRLGASLERIPASYKEEIGSWLLGRTLKLIASATRRESPDTADASVGLWALGRIGARQPFYGSAHDVVTPQAVEPWIESLLSLDWKRVEAAAFVTAQMARMTNDRARDLPPALRERIVARLATAGVPSGWMAMVRQCENPEEAITSRMLGESLPPGLRLIS